MLKIIRYMLYGLAILAGVLGLCIGGDPLVRYALELWRDVQNNYYYDTHYLDQPEIIVLLSLILLVGACIAMLLEKGTRPASPPDMVLCGERSQAQASADKLARLAVTPETAKPPVETADEKLTRLLNQKRD